jgi:hypothetical protein
MIKMILTTLVLFAFASPLHAGTKEHLTLVSQPSSGVRDQTGSIDPTRVLAIGTGVIVGGVAIGSIFNFMGSGMVGAVGGGMVANWWYKSGDDIIPLERK